MKTLIILMVLLTAGMAWAFTWEGDLDPNGFDNWKLLAINPNTDGSLWVFVRNPDQTSPIDTVAMETDLNFTLLRYRYFKHGEPYSYIFDGEKDKYVRHHFTDEQKKTCVKCHTDKLVFKKAI
jgi:hypothetical protein